MIILKKLNPKKDITKKYFRWMNDLEIQKFTEQRYKKNSMMKIKKFVIEKNKSNNEFLFGIFLKKKNNINHIGNIKLGPINFIHSSAEISYFIGDKNLWGQGLATKAIKKIILIAKKKKIKKLRAGFYEMNHGSRKVLEKSGFKLEGNFKSEVKFNNKRYSTLWYGKIL